MPARSAAAVAPTVVATSASEVETRSLAGALARRAAPGDRIALIGELGAGKTQFAKGFAAGLGIPEVVNSPSFTLMAEYRGRLPLFHLDLYRLAGPEEVVGGGLLDERQTDGVTLIEWAERLDQRLDPDRLEIRFTVLPDQRRRIELDTRLARYERYLEAARRWCR
jgi:tRNA threonylcarbamoyladenosine biosynthesis protein TsaE